MENKNLRVVMILTVISILLVFSGITYAYFSAFNNQGSTAEITVGPGKMLITYNDGTDNIKPVTNIQPSDAILVNKTFSLTGTNTATGVASSDGINMPYKVGLMYTSTFSDGQIHYYIKATAKSSNVTAEYTGTTNQTVQGNSTYTGYSHGTLKKGTNKYTEMVTGNFPSSTSNQTITFNLIIQFPDTGENQDSEKGATINGKIVINYDEKETVSQKLLQLYDNSTKDTNGITPDGLQKDGTGAYNIKNLSSTMRKYSVNLLGNTQNNIIADVETDVYDNIRYVGANPNNYLTFNNETWRILGTFSVYNVETKQYENLVKIIRNESLGLYSWDSSDSSVNDGYGINEWSQADLMTELNTDYLDTSKTSGTTMWYNGENNKKNGAYDYSNNIKSSYLDKIATVRWNLGASDSNGYLDVVDLYLNERDTLHVDSPTDGITRTDYWDGKIGLIYSSDFGFTSDDELCKQSSADCSSDSYWLNKEYDMWTLTSDINDSYDIFYVISSSGTLICYSAADIYAVYPTLYLKSDVAIKSGTGTSANPFVIS